MEQDKRSLVYVMTDVVSPLMADIYGRAIALDPSATMERLPLGTDVERESAIALHIGHLRLDNLGADFDAHAEAENTRKQLEAGALLVKIAFPDPWGQADLEQRIAVYKRRLALLN